MFEATSEDLETVSLEETKIVGALPILQSAGIVQRNLRLSQEKKACRVSGCVRFFGWELVPEQGRHGGYARAFLGASDLPESGFRG